jgi:hypothetical protein
MLTADKSEISACQNRLAAALKEGLATHERLRIGHQGGSFLETVFHGPGLWYPTFLDPDAKTVRYWNGFGTGKADATDQIIAVEINVPGHPGVGGQASSRPSQEVQSDDSAEPRPRSGSHSYVPSAHRYSMTILSPSL